jgi:hypothetical protein
MTGPTVVTAGELTADELLSTLQDDTRVVVQTEFLGSEHEVTLRWDGDTYYCDTPTRLHKHDSADEMRTCLVNQGYGRSHD